MSHSRIAAALALLALALLTLPAGASGDSSNPTWAGTWDSDFGRMTLDAGGSGNYVSPFGAGSSGSISGNVDGRVNQGTWKQPNSSGTFRFEMSGSGLTFTGDWEYDQGGCGSSCGWNGECIDGPCKENDDPAPAEPPLCGAASFLAHPSARACDLGRLPFGRRVGVELPLRDKTKDISPRELPSETYELILEILAEEEGKRLATALAVKFGGEQKAEDLIVGCLAVVHGGFSEFDDDGEYRIPSAKAPAVYNACARLLLSQSPQSPPKPRVAASGCDVVVVPLFEKGTNVTKRRRRRATAAIKDRVNASCDNKRKGFVASLKARGKGATLNRVTGKKIGAPLARFSDTPANGRRASVRWTARRR